MQRFHEDGLEWLEFDLLADIPRLKHAIFLRCGGYSKSPYSSLNTSPYVGDDPIAVQRNLERVHHHFSSHLPPFNRLIAAKACHGKNVTIVDQHTPSIVPDSDGLICQNRGQILLTTHADCQVALMYDPKHQVIANVHAGWRGNVLNIYAETISQMQRQFGSKPSELLVGITPSLGPEEAEFVNYQTEFPEELWQFQIKPTYFDLWAIARHQLQMAGVLPHHIEIPNYSNYANSRDFFSYRRDKVTGRHAACIVQV